MKAWGYIVAAPFAIYAVAWGYKIVTWNYTHFSPAEFGTALPFIADSWLRSADDLRERHGRPIYISPVTGAIARWIDKGNDGHGSWHNVTAHGISYAGDVFPEGANGPLSPAEAAHFRDMAKRAGFTGIGFYPDTMYNGVRWPMFHLDRRPLEPGEPVAEWGRFGGGAEKNTPRKYVGIESAFAKYRTLRGMA